jgi:hypothetical protein
VEAHQLGAAEALPGPVGEGEGRAEGVSVSVPQALEDGVIDAHSVALVEGVGLPLRRGVREALPQGLLDTDTVGEAETLALREPLRVMVAVED